MLQAMNTGHDGSLTTIHANSPRDALARLETMVLMAGIDLPSRAIREQIVSALYLIVHVKRYEDGVRRVAGISEILGLEGLTPLTQEIFRFERRGRKNRSVIGEYVGTGIVPRLVDELREREVQIPGQPFPETIRVVHTKAQKHKEIQENEYGNCSGNILGLVSFLPHFFLCVLCAFVTSLNCSCRISLDCSFSYGLVAALVAIVFLWRRIRIQELGRSRLAEPDKPAAEDRAEPAPARPFVRHYFLLPWLGAVVLAVGLFACRHYLSSSPPPLLLWSGCLVDSWNPTV